MNEYKNIDGMPSPKKPPSDKDAIDPEKFKKTLKVDASEESSKRDKRNRSKKAEEEEDEIDDTSASIPVPQGLFKEYMSEDEKKASALDAGEGTKAHFVPDGDESSPSRDVHIDDAQDGATSNISVQAPEPSSSLDGSVDEDEPISPVAETEAPAPAPEVDDTEDSIPTPAPSFTDEDDNYISTPDQSPEPQTTPTNQTDNQQKQTPTDNSKEPAKAKEKEPAKKSTKKKPAEEKKRPEDAEKVEKLKPEDIKTAVSKKKEKTEIKTDPAPKDKTAAPVNESAGISDQKHDGDKEKEPSTEDIAPVAAVPLASPAGIAVPPLSPFANMPKDVFDLFEKMVGFMQIAKDNGKSTTTVTLNMPNSVFNKCELVLEHFDTAPHAYNAQLLGSPEAIEKFAKNMKNLSTAITESKLTFSIHLLPPKLSKAYMGRVDRKDSDAEGGSSGGKGEKDTGSEPE